MACDHPFEDDRSAAAAPNGAGASNAKTTELAALRKELKEMKEQLQAMQASVNEERATGEMSSVSAMLEARRFLAATSAPSSMTSPALFATALAPSVAPSVVTHMASMPHTAVPNSAGLVAAAALGPSAMQVERENLADKMRSVPHASQQVLYRLASLYHRQSAPLQVAWT